MSIPTDPAAPVIPVVPVRETVVTPPPVHAVQTVAPVQAVVTPQAAVVAPVVRTNVVTMSRQRYAFDSIVVGLVGLFFTIIGLLAVTRAGFDGSMDDPVVDVLGFTHTVRLGLIEAALGICLLISAAATSRASAVFFGLVLGVGGFIGAVQTDSFERSLALESGLAWVAVVTAVIVVLVSLVMPRMVTRSERVEAAADYR